MDWFERLTGFKERDYDSTQRQLEVQGEHLVSRVNGLTHGVGRFELPSVAALRVSAAASIRGRGPTRFECVVGDARALHLDPRFAGATFQVASQFNALEMVSPDVTPEHGVTRYAHDRTQGPACAMAAGAATIWRNYFAPVDGVPGQTAERQIDTLAGLGAALSAHLRRPVSELWTMRNGYAIATPDGLLDIGNLLTGADEALRDRLRGQRVVAWHRDVEVTDAPHGARPRVSQVFCSALPVAYTRIAPAVWAPFARLVLEAAYEATLLAAATEHAAGGSNVVLLTRLGGGVFGNDDAWIDGAISRALRQVVDAGLEIKLVSYGSAHPSFLRLEREGGVRT